MSMSIKVEGVANLRRTLGNAADDLRDLREVNRQVAEAIRSAAHPPRRTGRLASSLVADSSPTEAEVSSSLIYAPVIEHGWRAHGIAPRHFLADAHRATEAANVKRYADTVDKALRQVKGV